MNEQNTISEILTDYFFNSQENFAVDLRNHFAYSRKSANQEAMFYGGNSAYQPPHIANIAFQWHTAIFTHRQQALLSPLRYFPNPQQPLHNGEISCQRVQNPNSFGVMPSAADILCNNIHSPLVCRNNDFNTALSMVKILVQHAAQVFQQLPSEAVTTAPKNQKQQFLDELPKEFCRKDYLTVANKLGIPDKTAEKHIKRFSVNGLIIHFAHDKYKKP